MPIPTFTPPVAPSPGTQIRNDLAVNRTPFGDGYTQNSPKGLNPVRRRVTLRWDALTMAQAQELETFFRDRAGWQVFTYTLRGDAGPSRWTCEQWSRVDGAPASFTAELTENFSAGTPL